MWRTILLFALAGMSVIEFLRVWFRGQVSFHVYGHSTTHDRQSAQYWIWLVVLILIGAMTLYGAIVRL